jgi:hypothetical protein
MSNNQASLHSHLAKYSFRLIAEEINKLRSKDTPAIHEDVIADIIMSYLIIADRNRQILESLKIIEEIAEI